MTVTRIRSAGEENTIHLICFDLGGVLIRICRTWQEAADRAAVTIPRPGRTVGPPHQEDEWNRVHHHYETGRCGDEHFFTQAADMAGVTVAHAQAILGAWLFEAYPGISELIDWVARGPRGAKTACLSNTNAYHWSMMTTEGPARLPLEKLTYRFTSFEIGASKPDPRIYDHVERVSGTRPRNILFFDDHPPNVQAATQRGWQAHQIDHLGDTAQQMRQVLQRYGIV